jgi:hypothetical protein
MIFNMKIKNKAYSLGFSGICFSRAMRFSHFMGYLDAIHDQVRENRRIVPKAAYTCPGIDANGHHDLGSM